MPEFKPSPRAWVRNQVAKIDETGDTGSVAIEGRAVIMLTMIGAKSGNLLKVPLMRVEHDGTYAAFGSQGGAPTNPQWVYNLRANPDIDLQDGTSSRPVRAREISGAERETWWERGVAAFPPYAQYQTKTDRQIPIFLLEPRA